MKRTRKITKRTLAMEAAVPLRERHQSLGEVGETELLVHSDRAVLQLEIAEPSSDLCLRTRARG